MFKISIVSYHVIESIKLTHNLIINETKLLFLINEFANQKLV